MLGSGPLACAPRPAEGGGAAARPDADGAERGRVRRETAQGLGFQLVLRQAGRCRFT